MTTLTDHNTFAATSRGTIVKQTHRVGKSTGRMIGGLYLMLALIGGPAYVLISETLLVPGDASATFQNVIDQEFWFRLSTAGWLVTTLIDVVIAYCLYLVLSPIAPRLALASMIPRLAYVAVHAASLTNLFDIISLLDSGADQIMAADVLSLADAHLNGFMISLMFFGAHLLILAALVVKTRFVPVIFAALLSLAGMAYIIDTFALALIPTTSELSQMIDTGITILATLGEVSFLLWLLVFGMTLEGTSK